MKDFEGQKLAETLSTALLSVVGVCLKENSLQVGGTDPSKNH